MRFGKDWPGLFIRGDDCMHLSHAIAEIVAGRTEAVAQLQDIAKVIDSEVLAAGGRTA
jgi:hypothetical protein